MPRSLEAIDPKFTVTGDLLGVPEDPLGGLAVIASPAPRSNSTTSPATFAIRDSRPSLLLNGRPACASRRSA